MSLSCTLVEEYIKQMGETSKLKINFIIESKQRLI